MDLTEVERLTKFLMDNGTCSLEGIPTDMQSYISQARARGWIEEHNNEYSTSDSGRTWVRYLLAYTPPTYTL